MILRDDREVLLRSSSEIQVESFLGSDNDLGKLL